jgi:hypothetical protein
VLAQAGVPERQIQEWCGHSSPAITRRYMHFAPASAADVDAINGAFGHVTNRVTNMRTASVPERSSPQVARAS